MWLQNSPTQYIYDRFLFSIIVPINSFRELNSVDNIVRFYDWLSEKNMAIEIYQLNRLASFILKAAICIYYIVLLLLEIFKK